MNKLLISIFLLAAAITSVSAREIKPFTTDYCTGYFEGTRSHPGLWKDCCLEHDLYFWAGGSSQERNQADKRLRACVADKGTPIHARLIYWGVKLGSKSPIKIKGKHWGNGLSDSPTYLSLTPEQVRVIEGELNKGYPIIPTLILENFLRDIHHRN